MEREHHLSQHGWSLAIIFPLFLNPERIPRKAHLHRYRLLLIQIVSERHAQISIVLFVLGEETWQVSIVLYLGISREVLAARIVPLKVWERLEKPVHLFWAFFQMRPDGGFMKRSDH